MSRGRNINHTEAEVDSLTKQLHLVYDNVFNDDGYWRIAHSAEDEMAMKMATEPITLKDGH